MPNRDLYITTASGRHFYYEDMENTEIVIEDIAFALARLSRYCGHTPQFKDQIYSVGQHSVLMTWFVMTTPFSSQVMNMATLLHDSTEYAFQDVPGPLKCLLPQYREMEQHCANVIEAKFGLPQGIFEHPVIKQADVAIRHNEADSVCTGAGNLCISTDHPVGVQVLQGVVAIEPWTIQQTYDRFMGLYDRLHASQNP